MCIDRQLMDGIDQDIARKGMIKRVSKITNMTRNQTKSLICAAAFLALTTAANAQAIDSSGQKFIPKGHSYDSSNRGLPTLNSYEDQTNNRADVFETEIYKARRDRAYWDTWVNSTHGTYLDGQPRLAPDY